MRTPPAATQVLASMKRRQPPAATCWRPWVMSYDRLQGPFEAASALLGRGRLSAKVQTPRCFRHPRWMVRGLCGVHMPGDCASGSVRITR